MGVFHALGDNWFTLLQSAGIIGSLLLAAASFRMDARSRQVSNLLSITENHRELWKRLREQPELSRVLKADVDLDRLPVREDEEMFLRQLILHLNSSYQAIKDDLLLQPEGLEREVRWFFSLPIPSHVWEKIKVFQDGTFVNFVESCRKSDPKSSVTPTVVSARSRA